MKQPDLFSEPGLARFNDPDTALEAAGSVDATELEGQVLRYLLAHPGGATSYAIAQAMRMSLVTVSPRLRPLVNKGLVVDSGLRLRGDSGRLRIVWRAA